MNRKKVWIDLLTLVLFLFAVIELFLENYFYMGMFACFGAGLALVSLTVPKYQVQRAIRVIDAAYFLLAAGFILYVIRLLILIFSK